MKQVGEDEEIFLVTGGDFFDVNQGYKEILKSVKS